MHCVARCHCSPRWLGFAVLATVALTAASCSADFDRFEQSLPRFGGQASSKEVTGSVPQRQTQGQARGSHGQGSQVQAAPLPPLGGMQPPATQASHVSSRPARGGNDVTGSVTSRGSPPAAGNVVHVIAPGETLMKLTRQYGKSLAEIAKANNLPPHTMVRVGDRIIIPGTHASKTAAQAQARTQVAAPKPVAPAPQPQQAQQKPAAPPAPKLAAAAPPASADTARMVTPAAQHPEPEKLKRDVSAPIPTFRWPVRGRVITAFGPRPSGQQNDGINVAVPEGTPIKAAEDGVVAYAGNELKTYGNLVLVRHSNGYVTAYAHASEILVKRDDPVKRGQVIAKAGQTGSVSAPQLHFEIRKGSTPVDPVPFLDKGGSS
jgi:murein DD-endopeptidase MepM/ murein hydrolase activator NlpD